MQASGTIVELLLMDGLPAARIQCRAGLIPAPGQYLLAHADGSKAPLATVIFAAETREDEIICAPSAPSAWGPGTRLHMRGPLGHGFALPDTARRVALIASEDGPRRLLALLDPAYKQGASVTLVCEDPTEDLPLQVEVQPLPALPSVLKWADYAAFDVSRESLGGFSERLRASGWQAAGVPAQVLVRAPMPCGGLAECGVCAVKVHKGTQLACEQGPVFDLGSLDLEI